MLSLVLSLICLSWGQTAYCPSANDLTAAYGSPSIYNQGWSITGGAAAATKASFNLIGGSVEFDVDFSGTNTGVNANIYTISPSFSGQFSQSNYCDGQGTGSAWCTEIDWIETNGNCGGQTTLHTRQGTGNDGCTSWGCLSTYMYNGAPSFHMKISYDANGYITIVRNGATISSGSLSPAAQALDWSTLATWYKNNGAVIYSSQWVGWVPNSGCGSSGDLTSSHFSISNLKITGKVVSGPTPALCSGSVVPPPTTPPPTYAPPTTPHPTTPHPTVAPPTTPKPTVAAPISSSGSGYSYCIDAPTQDGVSCAQHKAWGNCGSSWMVGECRKTCGTCGPCADIPVPGDPNTCAQQAAWGNCLQPFMAGRCDVACGRCVAGAAREADSGQQTGGSSGSSKKIGIIVGATVGGFVFIVAVVGLSVYFWHRGNVERV